MSLALQSRLVIYDGCARFSLPRARLSLLKIADWLWPTFSTVCIFHIVKLKVREIKFLWIFNRKTVGNSRKHSEIVENKRKTADFVPK